MPHYQCYFDASCRTKLSGCAFFISSDGQILYQSVQYFKIRSPNQAEMQAMVLLFQYIRDNIAPGSKVEVFGDTEAVICKLDGKSKRRRSKRPLYKKLYGELQQNYELTVKRIPRNQNIIAHNLARTVLDASPPPPPPVQPRKWYPADRKIIQLDDIILIERMKCSIPNAEKYQSKQAFYRQYGKPHKMIQVTPGGVLRDGYITYLILKEHGITECEVDVVQTMEIVETLPEVT